MKFGDQIPHILDPIDFLRRYCCALFDIVYIKMC